MTNSIRELEDASLVFVIGSNMTEAHPVVSYYVKRAVKKGATLIVNDPRRTDLVRWATHHVQIKPGSDIAYVNALMHEIFANGWANEAFLREHTENPDEIRAWVEPWTAERASEICGVPAARITEIARLLGTATSAAVCYTLGITEHICGTDNVKTLANLQMVLGNLGKPSAGLNPLRGQNNVQGACDMGALPNVFHNYQAVTDPKAVEKMEKAWGVAGLSTKVGFKMPTMLRKALDGGTKILYCLGDNTVQSEPNMAHTIKELQALELLIVNDIFPNLTTAYAHVVFPDYSWGEEEGTFTNTERRVNRVRGALKPPAGCRPNWWVLQELGKRLGHDLGFTSAKAIFEDMRKTATSYAGITFERLEHGGLQWPCPTLEHPGTRFLHKDGNFTRGKGLFSKTEWVPPAETVDAKYPFVLSTGRRLWHYHTGTQTRNSVGLENLFPEELLELHPDDAARLGVKSGDLVKATSRRGSITLRAWVTERSAPGLCWMAFHFSEACANVLTIDAFDPVTETAEYKVCAIDVEKVRDGEPLTHEALRQARP
jgi:formate dehydrogenase major subunit